MTKLSSAIPMAVKQAGADADAALEELLKLQEVDDGELEVGKPTARDDSSTRDDFDDEDEKTPDSDALEDEEPDDDIMPSGDEPLESYDAFEDDSVLRTELEQWRSRYQVLQGKYDSEIAGTRSQMSQMQAQMEELRYNLANPPQPAVPAGPAYLRHLKSDEIETYGEELLDAQGRMAQGVAESVLESRLEPVIMRLLDRIEVLEQGQTETITDSFWSQVEKQIPNAKQINTENVKWFEFLNTADRFGNLHRDIGASAINNGDSRKLVNLFNAFFEDHPLDVSAPAPAAKAEKSNRMASPPAAKPRKTRSSSEPVDPKAPRMFSPKQIEKFYQDKAIGRLRMTPKEIAALELEIEQAAMHAITGV